MARGVQRRDRDAGVARRDEEHLDAGVGLGGHQERVGDGAVADQRAGARQPEAGIRRPGLHRALAHVAVECDGEDLLALDRGRGPVLLQRFGSELRQRACGQHHRLQVGHRRDLATERGQHRRLLEYPETAAAQRFRRGGRQDVGLDQLRPQVAVEAFVELVELALVLGRAHRLGDGRAPGRRGRRRLQSS